MRDLKISASASSSKYKPGKSLANTKKKSDEAKAEVEKVKTEKMDAKKETKTAVEKQPISDHESDGDLDEPLEPTLTENTDSYVSDDEEELRKFDEDSSGRKGRDSHDNTPDFEGLLD